MNAKNTFANKLAPNSEYAARESSRPPIKDANRTGLDNSATPAISNYPFTFSISARGYHERLMKLISENLPPRLAGSTSEIARTGLMLHLINLYEQYGNYLSEADQEEAANIIAHARATDDKLK